MIIITAVCGLIIWYLLYGAECAINGGFIGRNQYFMHFPMLWEEITWIMPGGWKRKLKYCDGDKELAETLPGVVHFCFMHIAIPLMPTLLYIR
jgi:hypothetical protein